MATSLAVVNGQQFSDWDEFTISLIDWSVEARFDYLVTKADPGRKIINCRNPPCAFHIHVSYANTNESLRISRLEPHRSCIGVALNPRLPHSYLKWLILRTPAAIIITPASTAKEIPNAIQLRYGIGIKDDQARRVKYFLLSSNTGNFRAQYQMIPAYLNQITQANPSAHTALKINN
ncbi:MAG: hypothetical protein M1829_003200 [Trizodia sp. TS-e1964]|nr:MAG: hypothetical protein M1829_003200 [Trizodia sp. TS-e1964]